MTPERSKTGVGTGAAREAFGNPLESLCSSGIAAAAVGSAHRISATRPPSFRGRRMSLTRFELEQRCGWSLPSFFTLLANQPTGEIAQARRRPVARAVSLQDGFTFKTR
jgi:hypothetical protein